ncbi:MAG: hypothetical protein EOO43_27090, partial [Flavobacterium sp.]
MSVFPELIIDKSVQIFIRVKESTVMVYWINDLMIDHEKCKLTLNDLMFFGLQPQNMPINLYFTSLIDTLFDAPYKFVPRDAGFFSVFNFFIGSLSSGCKVYPYFNKNAIIKLDSKISHFCYLDNNIDNSWFNYFEPISYFSSDDIHQKSLYKNFQTTRGEFSSDLFKYPKVSQSIYRYKDFYKWRCRIHNIFKNYIKI